jgi:hypothetical protein
MQLVLEQCATKFFLDQSFALTRMLPIREPHFLNNLVDVCDNAPQGSPQNRPTVVTSKPANGSGLGLGCFTPTPPEEASLFSCANSVDHI